MKTNPIIIQRFNELEQKMKEVQATRRSTSHGFDYIDRQKFEEWSNSVLNLLKAIFGENSVHYNNFIKKHDLFKGYADQFGPCKGIFLSAKSDYEGGYLFRLDSLISAELIDDVLDQALYLLDAGHKDPACVIAGVALESSLKKLCDKNSVARGKLEKMNADLAKAGLYNVGMQKQITAWADKRNNAAHGNWDAYTSDDVKDMINGVRRFIAENL